MEEDFVLYCNKGLTLSKIPVYSCTEYFSTSGEDLISIRSLDVLRNQRTLETIPKKSDKK